MISFNFNWIIYDLSEILQLREFVWVLRFSVWVVFNPFLLIDGTYRLRYKLLERMMLVHLFQTKNPNFLDWISAFYTFLGKGLPSTLQPYRHFLTSNSVINLKKFSLFGFISTLRYVFFSNHCKLYRSKRSNQGDITGA